MNPTTMPGRPHRGHTRTAAAAAALTALLTALAPVLAPAVAAAAARPQAPAAGQAPAPGHSPKPGHSPGPGSSPAPSPLPTPVISAGHGHKGHGKAGRTAAAPPAPDTSGPQLSIAVSDGRSSVQEGDQLTYTVQLHNIGRHGARRLRLVQTLPAGLKLISATRRPATRKGSLTWRISLPAGHTDTFRVTGQVGQTPGQLLRLATVVCASAGSSTRPIVCGAHSDELPAGAVAAAQQGQATASAASGRTRMQVLRPVAAGLGLLLIISVTWLVVRRRRRISSGEQPGPS
jgi:uncharacterized repeat protein (TIGR01451 family)